MKKIEEDIRQAFNFMHELHKEIAMLFLEVEGMLNKRGFVRNDSGKNIGLKFWRSLEYHNYWCVSEMYTFYILENYEQNNEKFDKSLFFYINLDLIEREDNNFRPVIYYGTIFTIKKVDNIWIDHKWFLKLIINEPDNRIEINNKDNGFIEVLFKEQKQEWRTKEITKYIAKKTLLVEIKSSEDIKSKIINPMIEIYNSE